MPVNCESVGVCNADGMIGVVNVLRGKVEESEERVGAIEIFPEA
jgi:hypothetical protein